MEDGKPNTAEPIRLVFELSRAELPRLYDDLIQFHKGTKRVNRLRILAYDGMLAQLGLTQATGSFGSPATAGASREPDASIGLFQSGFEK